MYRKYFKRFLDILFSLSAFLILFPIFSLITVLLFIANSGRPFFIQERPGKKEKLFSIIKFKTMNDKKDSLGNLLSDEKRMTQIGKFIRKTSLDEIPQLINVIKGDMSLIGPRPLLPEYLGLYNSDQRRRHEVRPGITGLAQVNGRNAISWEQKFHYDLSYVKNINFILDIKILVKTLQKVLKSDGVNTEGEATTIVFKGNT